MKPCCTFDRVLREGSCRERNLVKILLFSVGLFLGLSIPKKARGFFQVLAFIASVVSAVMLFAESRSAAIAAEVEDDPMGMDTM